MRCRCSHRTAHLSSNMEIPILDAPSEVPGVKASEEFDHTHTQTGHSLFTPWAADVLYEGSDTDAL